MSQFTQPNPPIKPAILLLYGLDETSHQFEVESTLSLVHKATAALFERGWQVLPLQITHDLVNPLKPFSPNQWLVLNLCEGSPHQAFYYARVTRGLAELGYNFTGSDSWSLDETQFKWRMKALLEKGNAPTPRWQVVNSGEPITFNHFPAIVKPAAEHCSYGITRNSVVLNVEEAHTQVECIAKEFNGGPALIEEFLDSAEYNVSVWGSVEVSVLGISTMTYDYFPDIHDRLCTFQAKWEPTSEAYQKIPAICPAPITPELTAKIEAVAMAAYVATGVRDYGRVDLRLKNGQPMALDVNANCDVSDDGGFMNAARVAGLSYGEMLEQIIKFAIQRAPHRFSVEEDKRELIPVEKLPA